MKFNYFEASDFFKNLVLTALTASHGHDIQKVLAAAPWVNNDTGGKDSELKLLLNGHEIDIGAWAERVEQHIERCIAEGVAAKIREEFGDRFDPIYRSLEDLAAVVKTRANEIAGVEDQED